MSNPTTDYDDSDVPHWKNIPEYDDDSDSSNESDDDYEDDFYDDDDDDGIED